MSPSTGRAPRRPCRPPVALAPVPPRTAAAPSGSGSSHSPPSQASSYMKSLNHEGTNSAKERGEEPFILFFSSPLRVLRAFVVQSVSLPAFDDLLFIVAGAIVIEHPTLHIEGDALVDALDEIRIGGPSEVPVRLRGARLAVRVRVVEAEQGHPRLARPSLLPRDHLRPDA